MNQKKFITGLFAAFIWILLMVAYEMLFNDGLTLQRLISLLIGGAVFGILFSLSVHYALSLTEKKILSKISIDYDKDETLVEERGANHFKGLEAVGGKLALTNKRLIFKSHGMNIQRHQEDFQLKEIKGIVVTPSVPFLKNKLVISLAENVKHSFIVNEPQRWQELIITQMKSASN